MSDEEKLKAGDIVTLRSGGHCMTLETISGSGATAECVWFREGLLMRETIAVAALKVVEYD